MFRAFSVAKVRIFPMTKVNYALDFVLAFSGRDLCTLSAGKDQQFSRLYHMIFIPFFVR